MSVAQLPPAEYLRERFAYDPETGVVTWRERPVSDFPTYRASRVWNARYAGKLAKTKLKSGHLYFAIDHKKYRSHRLIWKWMTGEEPPPELDHEDTDRTNNRWLNLRPATPSQNKCNRGLQRNNTSGFKGVTWNKRQRKWIAQIKLNRKNRRIGQFDSKEAAAAAYARAAAVEHGEFARTAESLTQNPEDWK